jgi:hypothetical protein
MELAQLRDLRRAWRSPARRRQYRSLFRRTLRQVDAAEPATATASRVVAAPRRAGQAREHRRARRAAAGRSTADADGEPPPQDHGLSGRDVRFRPEGHATLFSAGERPRRAIAHRHSERSNTMENQIDAARLRAVCALRGVSRSGLARRLGISESYLQGQLAGDRTMTSSVAQALRDALGPEGWAFATRATDTMRAPPVAAAPEARDGR